MSVDKAQSEKSSEKTILILEDDYELLVLLNELLCSQAQILTCVNAEEAFQVMELHTPLVMIVDIVLGGMNGIDFIRKVKETHGSHAKMIVITGAPQKYEKECLEATLTTAKLRLHTHAPKCCS